jgi:hypothetical protein
LAARTEGEMVAPKAVNSAFSTADLKVASMVEKMAGG